MSNDTNKCAAIIQTGMMTRFFEGQNALDILNQLSDHQDLRCLCNHACMMGTSEDADEAVKIEAWLDKTECNTAEMSNFDEMDFQLSIGDIKCHAWAEGEEACKALKEKFNG